MQRSYKHALATIEEMVFSVGRTEDLTQLESELSRVSRVGTIIEEKWQGKN
jgi:hypothetical protein